jgi:hypothetical protein
MTALPAAAELMMMEARLSDSFSSSERLASSETYRGFNSSEPCGLIILVLL